jgi:outer membrane PBP1 activator LpoA protein
MIAVAITVVTACSSSKVAVKKAATINQTPIKVEHKRLNSDDYLRLAKQNGDSPTHLLLAAQASHDEQQYNKSLIIIKPLQKSSLPLAISQRLLVLEIKNYLALGHVNIAEKTFTSAIAKTSAIKHDVHRLKAQLYSQQNRYIESLTHLFELEKAAENGEISDDKNVIAEQIWQQLNQLPNLSLETFVYQSYTNAKAWIQLVMLTRRYTGEPSKLQRQLKNWYELHPHHAGMSVLPQSFQHSLQAQPYTPTKIAVLLPYSGRLRKQAQAIRNGLLVANQDKSNIELLFIDSTLPIDTVEQHIITQQAEFIIGPLRKEKVEAFAASAVIKTIPSLFLNRIAVPEQINQHHFFFGLTPEDEAKQAAQTLFKAGYKKPSIIAPRNSLGRRLSEMFTKTWLQQRSNQAIMTPETNFYADQAQMQAAVKNLMDVEQSKARIKQIKALLDTELKTESRNRKDLDVIYIIGNNVQTKLLKPFIDVNTSPFTTPIPVYATSRSHALIKPNDDKRDLRSLTFTEIPWLLQSEGRYANQRILFNELWPTVDESLRRLFALGYDALFLIDRIAQLRVLNGLTEHGMSGLISVDKNGFINRLHQWAKYNSQGQVEPVTFD